MRTLSAVPFTIPDTQMPKQFSGFVCVVFAGERVHAGCDANSADDAYWDAVRSARLSMADACAVDKSIDPRAHAGSVLMFQVESDPEIRVLVGEED